MTRIIKPKTPEAVTMNPHAEQPGGGFGIDPTQMDPSQMATDVGGPKVVGSVHRGFTQYDPIMWKVTKGGWVVYDSCRTQIQTGKVFPETAYDIEHLKRQGIELECINPRKPAPVEETEEQATA